VSETSLGELIGTTVLYAGLGVLFGWLRWGYEPEAITVLEKPEAITVQVGDTVVFEAAITLNGCDVTYGPLDVPREGYEAWGVVCPKVGSGG
jgi:hypothetical protein